MTTTATSYSDLGSTLVQLREFAALLELYRVHARRGYLPPVNARIRLKQLEAALPTQLAGYVWFLLHHPAEPGFRPVTSLGRKGCCAQCGIAAHPEWISSIARGEVIYVCAHCGAVFAPPRPSADAASTVRRRCTHG